MLALVAAFREEITGLRRQLVLKKAFTGGYFLFKGKYRDKDVILVQTGMDKDRTARATELILGSYPVTAVVSFGFGGALTGELKVGDIVLCSRLHCDHGGTLEEPESEEPYYSDAGLVSLAAQTLDSNGVRWVQGSSLTVPELIYDTEEKRLLGEAFPAKVVEMENYWVAKVSSARGVPFIAVRAIYDELQSTLPPFGHMLDLSGKLVWKRAVPYFLTHPRKLATMPVLYRDSCRARASLTAFVDGFIDRMRSVE